MAYRSGSSDLCPPKLQTLAARYPGAKRMFRCESAMEHLSAAGKWRPYSLMVLAQTSHARAGLDYAERHEPGGVRRDFLELVFVLFEGSSCFLNLEMLALP